MTIQKHLDSFTAGEIVDERIAEFFKSKGFQCNVLVEIEVLEEDHTQDDENFRPKDFAQKQRSSNAPSKEETAALCKERDAAQSNYKKASKDKKEKREAYREEDEEEEEEEEEEEARGREHHHSAMGDTAGMGSGIRGR